MVLAVASALLVLRPGAAGADSVDIEVEYSALFAFPVTEAVPDTLTSDVPPTAICVVLGREGVEGGCPSDLEPVTNELADAVDTVDQEAQPLPAQPVPPDDLAVAIFGGHHRYMSGLKLQTPDVPFGEQVDSFTLTLSEGMPTYHYSSPLFRQMIFAVFAQLADTSDFPATFQEELTEGLENEDGSVPPVDDETRLGIEVCPFTKGFEASPAPLAAPDDEIPTEDVPTNPDGSKPDAPLAVDCLRGANGVYDPDEGNWTFDLTLALKAWEDGTLQNHGLLFRHQGAENLAFGDPDTSSFFQTILDPATITAELVTSVAPPPLPPLTPGPPAPPPTFGQAPSGLTAPGPSAPSGPSAPAEQPQAPQVDEPAQPAPSAEAPVPAAVEVETPLWWLLLLAALFMAGWYLTQLSLTAEVVTVASKDGALAHLVARNGSHPQPPTQA